MLLAGCVALGMAASGGLALRSALADDGAPAPGPRYPVLIHRGAALPPVAQSKPVPLVIALHPSGGSPQWFEQNSGLDAVADEHGFVVAYLSSRTPTSPAWRGADMPSNLAYVSSEITQLTATEKIDPKRVYVAGFSAGATMSFFVGCQLSRQVAGIAVVSGAMRFTDPCKLAHPVSELLIDGTSDGLIPINGSSILLSAAQVADRWRQMNACTSQSSSSAVGAVTQVNWGSCNDSSGVGLYTILGGVHQWPGAPYATGPDRPYNAAEAIWAFFTAHPGPASLATPSASVTAVSVHRRGGARSIEAVIGSHESSVTARLTVRHRGAAKHTTAPRLIGRGSSVRIVLHLPAKASAGRYAVTVTLTDAYGRTATVSRAVHLPPGH
jgi:polyhydroxybutyrate depolymerase